MGGNLRKNQKRGVKRGTKEKLDYNCYLWSKCVLKNQRDWRDIWIRSISCPIAIWSKIRW